MKSPWLLLALIGHTKAYRIAIVPKNTASVGFFGLVNRGCKDFASLHEDVECLYNGTVDADVEGSLAIINDLIDDLTVDAISISVLDSDAYTPVINRGIELGKPILTFDSDAPDSLRLAYVGTDNYAMGRELAKLLKQVKPDGGTYGVVSGLGHNLVERVRGVREVLNGSAWKEVPYGSPKNGNEDIEESLLKMWELTEENPTLGAVVSVVGLPMFKEDQTDWKNFVNSNRDVLTVIADTLPIQLDLMQTSYVDALVGQLPYGMGYQSAQTLIRVLDDIHVRGIAFEDVHLNDFIFGTHQLEVLRIPLKLPPVNFNYNYIGNLAIVGYILCAIVVGASFFFVMWTLHHSQSQVVRASQPIFLVMICFGTVLMGSAIIPLSIDDEYGQHAANVACMCAPWLINIGFVISFSALFSKTWRLNQIFLSKNPLKRIKVTEKDVMLPFVALLTLNVITLVCWTAIAPLQFVRIDEEGTDPWNRPIGSYGQCVSTSGAAGASIPYLVVIAVINLTALVVANFQAYRARSIKTEFSEAAYIGMADASFLQAIVVCVPIIFLTRESPQAYFVVLSVVLFIASGAILGFIFVPKMIAVNALQKKMARGVQAKGSVRVSGLHLTPLELRGSSNSLCSLASYAGADENPVKATLDMFNRLSWEDKTAVLKKIAPGSGEQAVPLLDASESALPLTERDEEAASESSGEGDGGDDPEDTPPQF